MFSAAWVTNDGVTETSVRSLGPGVSREETGNANTPDGKADARSKLFSNGFTVHHIFPDNEAE